MPRRPRVILNPVADRYHSDRERIVEFAGENWGGLISFREQEDGTLRVELYRLDPRVIVITGRI